MAGTYLRSGTYYTISEVAEMLGLNRSTVKSHCYYHSHVGIKIGERSAFLLTDKDIDFIKTRLGKVGNRLSDGLPSKKLKKSR